MLNIQVNCEDDKKNLNHLKKQTLPKKKGDPPNLKGIGSRTLWIPKLTDSQVQCLKRLAFASNLHTTFRIF